MNKNEFLSQLQTRLSALPASERGKTISYYSEMIDDRMEDGMEETEAVAAMGDPEAIVREIISDTPLQKIVNEQFKKSREKMPNLALWITLAVLGSPLWLPLSIAVAAVIFVIYLTAWIFILSLFIALVALVFGGIAGFAGGIYGMFAYSPASGLFVMGAALTCAALAILLYKPIFNMSKQLVHFTKWIAYKIKALLIRHKETV